MRTIRRSATRSGWPPGAGRSSWNGRTIPIRANTRCERSEPRTTHGRWPEMKRRTGSRLSEVRGLGGMYKTTGGPKAASLGRLSSSGLTRGTRAQHFGWVLGSPPRVKPEGRPRMTTPRSNSLRTLSVTADQSAVPITPAVAVAITRPIIGARMRIRHVELERKARRKVIAVAIARAPAILVIVPAIVVPVAGAEGHPGALRGSRRGADRHAAVPGARRPERGKEDVSWFSSIFASSPPVWRENAPARKIIPWPITVMTSRGSG